MAGLVPKSPALGPLSQHLISSKITECPGSKAVPEAPQKILYPRAISRRRAEVGGRTPFGRRLTQRGTHVPKKHDFEAEQQRMLKTQGPSLSCQASEEGRGEAFVVLHLCRPPHSRNPPGWHRCSTPGLRFLRPTGDETGGKLSVPSCQSHFLTHTRHWRLIILGRQLGMSKRVRIVTLWGQAM